jgi:hypothetical protein
MESRLAAALGLPEEDVPRSVQQNQRVEEEEEDSDEDFAPGDAFGGDENGEWGV